MKFSTHNLYAQYKLVTKIRDVIILDDVGK